MQRRSFLLSGVGLGVAGRYAVESLALAATPASPPKKIAAVVTEYRNNSHADVIVGKYLDGFRQDGRSAKPRSRIVSMYTAQVPDNDMSRAKANEHNVPIYRTIWEALTLGTDEIAVDGVLLIGEHGDYPLNDKGQKLYPRFELFLEISDAFRRTGQAVPVFNDKHLSYSWIKAKRMVEISRELEFPFMAGSSVPVTHRVPDWDLEWGTPLDKAGVVAYGGKESYGFHMIEAMQSVVERRRGGETGVAWTECLEYEAVWNFLDRTPWAKKIFDACLTVSKKRAPGEPKELVKEPTAYLFGYNDGLEAATFMMNGLVRDFNVGVLPNRASEPKPVLMWLEGGKPYGHFACLVQMIEKMFESGRPTYPVERTLLVSGMLDFALESRFQGHKRLETPQLDVEYEAPQESKYCKGAPVWA